MESPVGMAARITIQKEEQEMATNGRYRNELKYNINYAGYIALRQRLRVVMKQDSHADESGRYLIRSIYFDDPNDKALREKMDGVNKREKFRIRYYNDDFSYLSLEKKMKTNNLCMKLSAQLTEDECRKLLAGDTQWMLCHSDALMQEFYAKMRYQQLRPRVLVSYLREAYTFSAGNVRICFDSNISSTLFHREFLENTPAEICVLDEPGEMIYEVKFDDYLPEFIARVIQTGELRQQAFSKYAACRRFG